MRRLALRVLTISGPLTVSLLLLWGLRPDILNQRPTLVFMVYQLGLLVSIGAAIVYVVAAGQIAVARAFAAGYTAGVVATAQDDGDNDNGGGRHARPLRVVE